MPVSFALFPPAAVGATVVEIEPSTVNVLLVGQRHGRARRRGRDSGDLRRRHG